MKKCKKLVLKMLVLTLAVSAFTVFGTTKVSAAESNENKSVEVVTNKQCDLFENEVNQLKNANAKSRGTSNEAVLTKEQFFELVKKYDGAERTVYESRGASYSEKFKWGGYNAFAYSKKGMQNLRDDYGACATLLITDGTLVGAMAGGVAGALVGAIGSNILATYFRDANNHMKDWINIGSSKGGCRITLTDEFPIAKLDTLSQSAIKKLK